MDINTIKNDYILSRLRADEELIGFFQATYTPPFWMCIMFPPLYFCMSYYVAVTDYGLHILKFNLWNEPTTYDFYPYMAISKFEIGNGLLTIPLKIYFTDGRKVRLKAALEGGRSDACFDDRTRKYLRSLPLSEP